MTSPTERSRSVERAKAGTVDKPEEDAGEDAGKDADKEGGKDAWSRAHAQLSDVHASL